MASGLAAVGGPLFPAAPIPIGPADGHTRRQVLMGGLRRPSYQVESAIIDVGPCTGCGGREIASHIS
jgi:hypothetical protein